MTRKKILEAIEPIAGQLICGALGCREPIEGEKMIYSSDFGQLYHAKCLIASTVTEAVLSDSVFPRGAENYRVIDRNEALELQGRGEIRPPLKLKD